MPQPTLFNYFTKTPKAEGSDSPKTPSSVNGQGQKQNGVQNGTPTTSKKVTPTSSPRTPVSRRNGGGVKRSLSEKIEEGARKKIKNGVESPPKDLSSGALVWAKLEGYPWWPSMIRGEKKGGSYFRAESMEFHVQFFDNPPTRAWIRKGDLKPYAGSTDADIPPAKSDRSWVEACKTADIALSMKNAERTERYWHDFSNDEGSASEAESPKDEKMETDDSNETPKSRSGRRQRREESKKKLKRVRTISSSDDEDENKSKQKDNEEDDYSPTKNGSEEESEESESPEESDAEELSEGNASDEDSDGGSRKKKSSSTAKASKSESRSRIPVTPSTSKGTPSTSRADVKNKLQQFNLSAAPSPASKMAADASTHVGDEITTWKHMTWKWAQPGNRKDIRQRAETHPDYDSRTLFVPPAFIKELTPGMRQWWEIKMRNLDTILFFKVGKFYEFYHWDACIAAEELGITFMKGDYAHSGFPEISFTRFSSILVEKGYKIARIEQTETPEMLKERVAKSKGRLEKHEKVISREICQISTKGVRYASFQDDMASNPFAPESTYLYAIAEKPITSPDHPTTFGVCFVDTTIGTFYIGQFTDDRHFSRLRTLFSHYVPVQILHERNKISSNLQHIFHNMTNVRKEALLPDTEFWNAKKTLKYLAEQTYFRDDSGALAWPTAFQTLSEGDGLGLTANENWEFGVKSLGGVIWYLKYCLLENDLLTQKRFEIYQPVDDNSQSLPERCLGQKYMVLDGITIRNLDVLTGPLSLLSTIDKCGTNFGKRLLHQWVCLPLAIPEEIADRQKAVEELLNDGELRDNVIPELKKLPDLERLLSKIHYLGSAHRSKHHPDGRASFYEDVKYSKSKISDLLSTLRGFKTCVNIIAQFRGSECQSPLINRLVHSFPTLDDLLTQFDNAFDHQLAVKEGKIKPQRGSIKDYDDALQAVIDIQTEADDYLKRLSREWGAKAVFFGSDKKRFQIEVAEHVKIPRSFEFSSRRKGFNRYVNDETQKFLSKIQKAESHREDIIKDVSRKIFEMFDDHRETWSKAVEVISNLDVLISLAIFSGSQENMCRPVITYPTDGPYINIVEGRHPCIASDNYIPNDTILGLAKEGEEKREGNFVILTGPNMGGKSTLMRQVGLLSILSHLGCYVPASRCEMSVVDRIFTRLGANDNIGEGESTFFVEMSETSAILKHATSNSLLLIDELGRGTATYDGTAIAYAVANELSGRNCRSLFSTHYHTLVDSLKDNEAVQMCHMACMVENEDEQDPTNESIYFLYKMISGACPKSYGFNAAKLAGIHDDVIRVASKKAKELEASVAGIRSFTSVCSSIRKQKLSLKDFASLTI